jgi:hypothetical protein
MMMPKLQEIRESIEAKLDKWEASALALKAQLKETKDKAADRVEDRKKELSATLNRLRSEVGKSKTIAEETRTDIVNRLEHLQVQLALGKLEARDEYMEQKKKIHDAVSSLETSIDRQFDEAFGKLGRDLVRGADALDAEFSAFLFRLEEKKERIVKQTEDKKEEILAQLHDFQDKIQEKRGKAKEKTKTFEDEFTTGLKQIRDAFTRFFH